MTHFTLDMDPGAYMIGWGDGMGGFSPAVVWMTENGERMICCSNWISPTKVANVIGLPIASLRLIGSWVPAGEVPEGDGFDLNEVVDAIAQGVAKLLQGQQELAAAGLRGADRGVAIMKRLQEVDDQVRKAQAIGVDIGQKVEACMALASNTEEGLAHAIGKIDNLGIEKWREAIKHVEARDPGYGARKDAGATNDGFQAWSSGTGLIMVAYRGDLYTLSGRQLIPIEIVARS